MKTMVKNKREYVNPSFLEATSSSSESSTTNTRLQRRVLILARAVWIVLVLPALGLFIARLPTYFAALHLLRSPNVQPFTGQLTLDDVHMLQGLGLSLDFYAAYMVVISCIFQFSYAAVGALIFWRKSNDRVAYLVSFALMMVPFGYAYLTLQGLPPGWSWLVPTLMSLGNISIMLCAYVFPTGRFEPRWIRWLALVMIGYWVSNALFPSWSYAMPLLGTVLLLSLIVSTMTVQVYRYRYVSTPQQRQQTRWVVFGTSITIMVNIAARLLCEFILYPLFPGSSFIDVLEVTLVTLSMLVIPPALGIAILYSRLWDIDVIINRTLVYGTLTVALGVVYLSLIVILQEIFRTLTGQQQSEPVTVLSTLVIAWLFQPFRGRIQTGIDRRFYRSKYDAARTLESFGQTLREEIDLAQLCEHLTSVVEETMQPSHISLLLYQPNQDRRKTAKLPSRPLS